MDSNSKISKIIKVWVERSEFSQLKLAEIFKISGAAFNTQLNGKKSIPTKRIAELIVILKPSKDEVEELNTILEPARNLKIDSEGRIKCNDKPRFDVHENISQDNVWWIKKLINNLVKEDDIRRMLSCLMAFFNKNRSKAVEFYMEFEKELKLNELEISAWTDKEIDLKNVILENFLMPTEKAKKLHKRVLLLEHKEKEIDAIKKLIAQKDVTSDMIRELLASLPVDKTTSQPQAKNKDIGLKINGKKIND